MVSIICQSHTYAIMQTHSLNLRPPWYLGQLRVALFSEKGKRYTRLKVPPLRPARIFTRMNRCQSSISGFDVRVRLIGDRNIEEVEVDRIVQFVAL